MKHRIPCRRKMFYAVPNLTFFNAIEIMRNTFAIQYTLLLCLLMPFALLAQNADIILTNGKIFTADTMQLYVEALAIKGNKIIAIGKNEAMQKFASRATKHINLQDRTVVPGFNDAHDHLGWLVPTKHGFITEFSVPGPTRQQVIDSLNRLVKKSRPNQWLYGTIGLSVFGDTSVRRKLLDSIAPHNPVALLVMWGHGMIANSEALKTIGLNDTASDPVGGWYERMPGSNVLSGAFYEYAQFPFWQAVTLADSTALINRLRSHAQEQLQYGITSVQNMSSTLQANAAKVVFKNAALPVRTRIIAMPATNEKGRQMDQWEKLTSQLTPLTAVSGIKYMIDGTSLERTALKTKPYPGTPNYFGRLDFPVDTIRQLLKEALTTNRQLLLHITGDSATKVVLQLMKTMAAPAIWQTKRVRIEHGNGITNALTKDVKDLGIIVVHTPQYGANNPLQSWVQMGIPVAMGPDGLINPFVNIAMVCSRQVNKAENLTREQAVIAYTRTGAYAEFADKEKGTLTPGMVADIAVLSQDIFSIPFDQLPQTRSVMTIVNGKVLLKRF